MPGRMFSDRLASARQRALGAQADKEDEKASARRAAIVQGLPDPDDPNPPPPPAPSWFQQHNPFDVGALKSDLSSLGSRITHPVDTWKAANRGVISGVRSIDSYTDAGDKAIHNYLDDSPVGQFARGGKNLVRDTAKGLFDTVQGLSEVPAAVAPVLWRGLKPGAHPDDRKGAHDILKILDGQGVEDVRKVLTDKPWRNIDPGYEHASKAKTPWERAGGYTAATAMALLPTKYGKAALGKTLSGVANVGGELIESASAAGRSGIGATLDAVGDLKNRMTPPPKVPLTGQTSPRFPRALPAFGETTPGGKPFVSHPDIGVGHPNNPVLGVVEQQGGRSRFSIRGQRPAPVPPPPIIESPYTANLLPAAGEGSASRKFPERVFTSHPDLGIALPEEPPLGVVEKFAPKPVSAGMGRTPAAQMSPATRAFEALVPDRYKGALTPEGLAVNKLGEVSGPPRKGLRTLTETGLKNPTTTTSLAEMVDMYGLEEAAQRAQMTTKEVTDYLARPPKVAPQAAVPIAPSAAKLGPVTAGEVPPVVQKLAEKGAESLKKGRTSRARPVAAPKAAAPVVGEAPKSRPFEKSPTRTLESLAKRGNPHALAELEFRKANPHLQKTTNTTGEQGAIGRNINKPWGEIDTSEYSLNDRREAIKDAINRAYEQDTYGMSPKARERINREIRSLEMIQNVLADDTLSSSGGSSWPGASNKKFFYGEDPKAPGGISSAISGRITTKAGQPALKIPYLGSIIPGEGRKLIKGLQKWGLGKGAKEVVGSPLTDARPVYESMGARPESPGAHGYEGSFGNIAGLSDEQIYKPYLAEMPEGVARRMEKYQKKPTPKTEAELANEAALQDAQRGAEDARRNAGSSPGSSRSWDRSGTLPDEDFSDWIESLDHDTRRHYDHANVPEDVMEAVTRQPDVVGDRPYREAQIRRFEALEQEGSISRADQDALDDWRTIHRHETGSMSVGEPARQAGPTRRGRQLGSPMNPELEHYLRQMGVNVNEVRSQQYLRDSWEGGFTRDRTSFINDVNEARATRGQPPLTPPEGPTPMPRGDHLPPWSNEQVDRLISLIEERVPAEAPAENLPSGMTPDNAASRRALADEARMRAANPRDRAVARMHNALQDAGLDMEPDALRRFIEDADPPTRQAASETPRATPEPEPQLGPVEGSDEWWADNERGAVRLPSWNQVKAGGRKVKKGVGIGLDAANQVRIASMLSGWALPKSVLGNVGAHVAATAENIAAGKGRASFAPIKEGLNLKANLKEFKSGWKQGANPLIASSSNLGKYNPITRTMGAADHAATKSLMRSGLTEQQAQRLLLTDPQYGMKGATSKVLDYLVPFRKIPFNVLQGGAKTMGEHPLLSLGASGVGAGVGTMSDDPRVLALTAALMGPYTLPYLMGSMSTAGPRAIQGLSPIPEWSLQKSLGDPLHPFAEPSFFKMFDEGGQKKKSYREKIGDRSAKPRGRKVPKR